MPFLDSNYRQLIPVALPFANRQKYMHTFDLANPVMAEGFEDYLEPVRALCSAARAIKGFAHLTIDERLVLAGTSQRRPKPHVDGCFVINKNSWIHDPGPHWAHSCNNIPLESFQRMSVIITSTVIGTRAWRGVYEGQPTNDGDLSHLTLGEGEILPPNFGYLLSPDCIHESMLQPTDVSRTFLRIALPIDYKFEVN